MVPADVGTWFALFGPIIVPLWIALPGTVVTTPAPVTPRGAQPTHPGPEYQLTNAGDQAPLLPGIQNQPKPGEKFQRPL